MTYHTKSTSLASVAALAVGALLAFAPMKAEALTITLQSSLAGSSVTFTDGGLNDTNSDLDAFSIGGTITSANFAALGGFTIRNLSASRNENGSSSEVSQTALDLFGGEAGETLTVITSSGFSAGANDPDGSRLTYSLSSSDLGGTLDGFGSASSIAGLVSTDTVSFNTTDNPFGGQSAAHETGVLADPFDLTSTIVIGATPGQGNRTSFTSTVTVAPIPLPASALLLLGGLGGLGGLSALRRRKRTA